MKKGLFILIGILCFNLGKAQAQATSALDSLPFAMQQQIFIYEIAKKYNDQIVQLSTLYQLLSWNPENVAVLDSMALLYYDMQQFVSAAIVSQDALKINPDDRLAMQVAAISFEKLGVADRALPYYEQLYLQENDLGMLYQISFLQYELNRYNEALNNIETVLADKEAMNRSMLFPRAKGSENQEVSLLAATYRLKAMVNEEQGNIDQAKALYLKAIEAAPGFELAQLQLQQLSKN